MHFHTRKMKLIFCVVKKKRAHELTNLRGSSGEEGRNLSRWDENWMWMVYVIKTHCM